MNPDNQNLFEKLKLIVSTMSSNSRICSSKDRRYVDNSHRLPASSPSHRIHNVCRYPVLHHAAYIVKGLAGCEVERGVPVMGQMLQLV